MNDRSALEERVLEEVTPSREEEEELQTLAEELISRLRQEGEGREVEVEPVQVGSTSRGTWLSGDRDIDIFLKLPTELERQDFVDLGLDIASSVADAGDQWEASYAEHPYVKAKFGSVDVDLVPCYDVEEAGDIRSAVDRTPFHDRYLRERIEGVEEEVRLLKGFMKGIGVYSAEAKVQGFSGYLTELLVLVHGGFTEVLEAASGWRPGESYDPEGAGTAEKFDSSLVFVDPVDPDRNVAAALSLQRFAAFVRAASEYLDDPDESFFFPPKPQPETGFRERGGYRAFVEIEVKGMVEDNLYPQLRKTEEAVTDSIRDLGFELLRSEIFEEGIALELHSGELPKFERHEGPPAWVEEHADAFAEKYSEEGVTGPWIDEDGRLVVERSRSVTTIEDALRDILEERKGFGKTLRDRAKMTSYTGRAAEERIPEAFLSKELPWKRG